MNIEDLLYPFLSLYNKTPNFLKKPIGKIYAKIPLAWRYGETYRKYKKLLKESANWTNEKVEEFSLLKLKETFINAYENTEYYKDLFDSIEFNPYEFADIRDLQKIPFSDKDILRQNKDKLLNKNIPKKKRLYVTTGGTSGVPVEVYFTKGVERSKEFVFMTDQWFRIGYENRDRIARLRGTVVDHKGNNKYFKYEPIKNRLYLSTYDLTEQNFNLYINKLLEFDPHFIHTYPSAIVPLAKYLSKKDFVKFHSLKGILCSSEQFYPGQRELLESVFKVRIFSWYGHTENTTLAGECEHSDNYHIYHEYGYTELIDEKNNQINEPGIKGEIVGTSYDMKGFPIIRYRTGDFGEYVNSKCKCGRNYKLLTNVVGRWHQEMIQTKLGHGISLTALNMHSNIFDNVIQFQFHQKEKGKVVLKIIKGRSYSDKDEKAIYSSYTEKFKDMVDLEIEYVTTIPRTIRGKHKFLLQELRIN